ncbi:hypothetical protein ACFL1P_00335 [Patescibacteria group bacterium]
MNKVELQPIDAVHDPIVFSVRLHDETWTPHLHRERLQQFLSVHTLATSDIDIDHSHSDSYVKDGVLCLGTQPLEPAKRKQILFDSDSFEYADEMKYRLLRAYVHIVFAKGLEDNRVPEGIISVINGIHDNYHNNNIHVTLHSMHVHNFQEVTQQRLFVDIVELLTMYAYDPDYLDSYLKSLNTDHTVDVTGNNSPQLAQLSAGQIATLKDIVMQLFFSITN